MTLLIALILIEAFDLGGWYVVLSIMLWFMHLAYHG